MLYTINHIYPNKTFNFTLTAELMACAPKEHLHDISDVTNLSYLLSQKSDVDHTHTALPALNVNSEIMSGSITLTGISDFSIANTGNNVSFTVTPTQTNTMIGVLNQNPNYAKPYLTFFLGSGVATPTDESFVLKLKKES